MQACQLTGQTVLYTTEKLPTLTLTCTDLQLAREIDSQASDISYVQIVDSISGFLRSRVKLVGSITGLEWWNGMVDWNCGTISDSIKQDHYSHTTFRECISSESLDWTTGLAQGIGLQLTQNLQLQRCTKQAVVIKLQDLFQHFYCTQLCKLMYLACHVFGRIQAHLLFGFNCHKQDTVIIP